MTDLQDHALVEEVTSPHPPLSLLLTKAKIEPL